MLPDGTLVSGDSLGNVQFWDAQHGTLLQGFARHRGPVLALAALPDGRTIFASGVDNQVGSSPQCFLGQLHWAAAVSGPGTFEDRQTDIACCLGNQAGVWSSYDNMLHFSAAFCNSRVSSAHKYKASGMPIVHQSAECR